MNEGICREHEAEQGTALAQFTDLGAWCVPPLRAWRAEKALFCFLACIEALCSRAMVRCGCICACHMQHVCMRAFECGLQCSRQRMRLQTHHHHLFVVANSTCKCVDASN